PRNSVVTYLAATTPAFSTFPYTTLFRSYQDFLGGCIPDLQAIDGTYFEATTEIPVRSLVVINAVAPDGSPRLSQGKLTSDDGLRSEEHTSELQSRENLVCRLLLEKKKKQ